MKFPLSLLSLLLLCVFFLTFNAAAQKHRAHSPKSAAFSQKTNVKTGVVIDETLAVLRASPSLFADARRRLRRGREVRILGEHRADGVAFYEVAVSKKSAGWIQTDAVFGKFRKEDELRLARLALVSRGFEQMEITAQFLEIYPDSKLRPAILLLFGDLAEYAAAELSRSANKRLKLGEMAAIGAPVHSFYLNFGSLDRYRRLGIVYFFDPQTKKFYYNGKVWREITKKFPASNEAAEARKRLEAIEERER